MISLKRTNVRAFITISRGFAFRSKSDICLYIYLISSFQTWAVTVGEGWVEMAFNNDNFICAILDSCKNHDFYTFREIKIVVCFKRY